LFLDLNLYLIKEKDFKLGLDAYLEKCSLFFKKNDQGHEFISTYLNMTKISSDTILIEIDY